MSRHSRRLVTVHRHRSLGLIRSGRHTSSMTIDINRRKRARLADSRRLPLWLELSPLRSRFCAVKCPWPWAEFQAPRLFLFRLSRLNRHPLCCFSPLSVSLVSFVELTAANTRPGKTNRPSVCPFAGSAAVLTRLATWSLIATV
ncbi:unnamed protein product [Soboliphyme baturini]|uniref:Uncharacterized protein n=1 Tax=Soboliphyme baturini TaxID=241478 RepID=A0A183IAR9_9BILA|nr:unnamed protein product [Soboliphyme baturini]